MAFDINKPPEGITVPTIKEVLPSQTNPVAQTAKTETSDPLIDAVKRISDFRKNKAQETLNKGKTGSASSPKSTGSTGDTFDSFKYALGQQESSGDYKAVSPKNFDGDQAYGKYQVKGSNIPAWTKQYLGESMSVQDFLNNPEAQEKLFQARATERFQKYGNWNDVAAEWFSGRPLQNNNSQDVTGTTVPKYVQNIQALMKQYNAKNGGTSPMSTNVKTGQTVNLGGLSGTLTTNYGESTKYEKVHPGIDIAGKQGTNIPAMKSGKVVGVENKNTGFGNSILVQDAQGNVWRYSHLKQNFVKTGQTIQAGQSIGTMGNTGNSYSSSGGDGSHLDLRVSSAAKKFLNPLSLI